MTTWGNPYLLRSESPPGTSEGRRRSRLRPWLARFLSGALIVLMAVPLQQPFLTALQSLVKAGLAESSFSEEDETKSEEAKGGKWAHSSGAVRRSHRRRPQPEAMVLASVSRPWLVAEPAPDSLGPSSSPSFAHLQPTLGRGLPLRC